MARYRQSDYGKYSGASADNDDLSLNRCPDCDVLFDGEVCPICKKECPPEMRAGVRQPIRRKKEKVVKGATMTPFYFRWWFIAVMFFISRLIALILLWMSDLKKWLKVLLTVIFALVLAYETLMMTGVLPELIRKVTLGQSVNYSISEEEYRLKCGEIDGADMYRDVYQTKEQYVRGNCTVEKVMGDDSERYYIIKDGEGNLLCLYDARKGTPKLFLAGDTVTYFGQCAGELFIYYLDRSDYTVSNEIPLIYMAYADLNETEETEADAKAA